MYSPDETQIRARLWHRVYAREIRANRIDFEAANLVAVILGMIAKLDADPLLFSWLALASEPDREIARTIIERSHHVDRLRALSPLPGVHWPNLEPQDALAYRIESAARRISRRGRTVH